MSGQIQDYSFVLEVQMLSTDIECSTTPMIEVEVRDGRTTRFGSCKLDATLAQRYGSVAALFETIRAVRKARPPHFQVRFNPSMGYPEDIYLNNSRTTADYSVQYLVREFRVTER